MYVQPIAEGCPPGDAPRSGGGLDQHRQAIGLSAYVYPVISRWAVSNPDLALLTGFRPLSAPCSCTPSRCWPHAARTGPTVFSPSRGPEMRGEHQVTLSRDHASGRGPGHLLRACRGPARLGIAPSAGPCGALRHDDCQHIIQIVRDQA